MSFDLGLAGRRALVTAGTKGIGAAVVEALRANGVTVVTTARSVPADAPEGVYYIAADVTTAQGCACVARFAKETLGGIDMLVHVLACTKKLAQSSHCGVGPSKLARHCPATVGQGVCYVWSCHV